MPTSVVMPALEMAQETGKVVSWLKKEGERVAKGDMPKLFHESDDPDRKVPIVWDPKDFMVVVAGDPWRNNAYVMAHNAFMGYPTGKQIRLPANWDALLAQAARELHAVFARQAQVEEHQIHGALRALQHLERFALEDFLPRGGQEAVGVFLCGAGVFQLVGGRGVVDVAVRIAGDERERIGGRFFQVQTDPHRQLARKRHQPEIAHSQSADLDVDRSLPRLDVLRVMLLEQVERLVLLFFYQEDFEQDSFRIKLFLHE
mgnify:CR=1 FL=1